MGVMTLTVDGDRDQQELLDAERARSAQQNPAAFAAIYEAYVDAVYGYCWRLLRDSHAAADATSETFIKALKALPKYQSRSFRGWLFTIAHRVVIDMIRRHHPTTSLDHAGQLIDRGTSPEEHFLAGESDRRVVQLLDQLPELQRHVVELRMAGLKSHEIATVLGRRDGAIRTAQYRAHERLRQLLRAESNTPKEATHGHA
jgi:RNA polymerase sigma-70 factor (ECF subfamily)